MNLLVGTAGAAVTIGITYPRAQCVPRSNNRDVETDTSAGLSLEVIRQRKPTHIMDPKRNHT